jgi:methyl-accepting chemotaxis protein
MKNLKIQRKLFMMVFPSILVLLAVIIFSLLNSYAIFNKSYSVMYDQLYINTELLLNADRDLYQALLSEKELQLEQKVLTKDARDSLLASFDENYKQAGDRIASITNNMKSNKPLYEQYIHTASGKNLKTLMEEFEIYFNKWIAAYDPSTGKGDYDEAQGYFDQARERIDFASQLLDDYAIYESDNERSSLNTNTNMFVVGGAVIWLLLTIYARAVSKTIKQPVYQLKAMVDKLAQGDLTVYGENDSKDELGDLQRAFNKTAQNFRDSLSEISNSTDQVASGSSQVSDGAQGLSQGSTEQASATEQIAETVNKMKDMIRNNARNADEANSISSSMGNDAVKGNDEMGRMLVSMKDINDSSKNIAKIIKVIDDIAFQTNLLALNAAVEAAHAGQYGKGFAVVAEEVRKLAARSANAAKDTTSLIEDSIQKVNIGTKNAQGTAEVLERIVDSIKKSSELIKGITESSKLQASEIEQLNTAVNQISAVVQSNSATAEESAAASEELNSQVVMLKEMVSRFTLA